MSRDHQGVSSIWLFEPGSFGHNSVYASCTLLGTQASSILGPARLCYTLNGAHDWWERFCLFWTSRFVPTRALPLQLECILDCTL